MENFKKPKMPKRFMITNGMPNGNKPMHVGHIAIFTWTDTFARFCRDMIGFDNVLFVCGTDGFGSSTDEKYRKLKAQNKIDITLFEYITNFNNLQKQQIKNYQLSPNLFSASCLGDGLKFHTEVSHEIFNALLKKGVLKKVETEQFYDESLNVVLNGRQVEGVCPIDGCKGEVGYADECDLGHQYNPKDLINPKSTLSGNTPVLKKVGNYYLDLEQYREQLSALIAKYETQPEIHKFITKTMKEYMLYPSTFIQFKYKEKLDTLISKMPEPRVETHEKKQLFELKFKSIADRDVACQILKENDINFKNTKSLAPLRISGNAAWGVPLPEIKGDDDWKNLTFYVWPESLWAPISFTKQYLSYHPETNTTYKDWWCSKDCKVVQVLGEDNLYFYGLCEPAIWLSLQNTTPPTIEPEDGQLQMPTLCAMKHVLYGGQKASSSGALTAPTADNLLEHYTSEQLRCYFLSLGINNAAAEFKSKVFSPDDYVNCGDPLVAPANLLTNIFNRLIRSVFYSLYQYFDGKLPNVKPADAVVEECNKTANSYVEKMLNFNMNEVIVLLDEFFRKANQNWSQKSKSDDLNEKAQLIADTIHIIKTGLTLVHPIAPESAEKTAEYMNVGDKLWNYDNIETTIDKLCETGTFKQIPPQFDFFKKHESQIK